jgi:nucleoside-diphosphate-sugar epimerase
MQVFVAGATGVLGRRIVRRFLEAGYKVAGLSRSERNDAQLQTLGAEPKRADLFDSDSLARAAEGADIVTHAATAIPTQPKPRPADWELNDRIRREGTRALAEAAARIGARLFLFQSITWVARHNDGSPFDESSPINPDPLTQSAADGEQIAREIGARRGLAVGILRCGLFCAPDAASTRMFGEALRRRRLPIVGRGDARWSLVHAADAAGAFLSAANAGREGLWHVVDDEPVSVGELLGTLAAKLGAPPPRRVPRWLARLVGGEIVARFMTTPTATSNRRLREETGWAPRFPTYREGLKDVVAAWRAEGFLQEATTDQHR